MHLAGLEPGAAGAVVWRPVLACKLVDQGTVVTNERCQTDGNVTVRAPPAVRLRLPRTAATGRFLRQIVADVLDDTALSPTEASVMSEAETTFEFEASRVVFVSRPGEVARFIERAASAAAR